MRSATAMPHHSRAPNFVPLRSNQIRAVYVGEVGSIGLPSTSESLEGNDRCRDLTSQTFLDSPQGRAILSRSRRYRRMHLSLPLEPKSKQAMRMREKDRAQQLIAESMAVQRRRSFRAPVAVRMWLSATAQTPPHMYSAVKNILDLFGRPLKSRSGRQGLVYFDDSQVWSLSVAYQVPAEIPRIRATFAPFSDFVADLGLAQDILGGGLPGGDRIAEQLDDLEPRQDAIDDYFDHLANSGHWPAATFKRLAKFLKTEAQREFFQHSRLGVSGLCALYSEARMLKSKEASLHPDIARAWADIGKMVRLAPLRLELPPPPHRSGDTKRFNREIHALMETFQQRFSRVLHPLVVPVALEVAYRPSGRTTEPQRDLDNLTRVVTAAFHQHFEPPANLSQAWATSGRSEGDALPPKSMQFSVVRLSVYQIKPQLDEDHEGYFVLGIAPDPTGLNDPWSLADDVIDEWMEQTW